MKVTRIVIGALLTAAALGAEHAAPIPVIKQNGAVKKLFVDNTPFVILSGEMQNSTGSFGDSRDRSPLAQAAWAQSVPGELMNYMIQHKADLLPELREMWARNDSKISGKWSEVFGSDERADEIFMGYYAGRFVGQVAKAGKAELNLPMFVNAFLVILVFFPDSIPAADRCTVSLTFTTRRHLTLTC